VILNEALARKYWGKEDPIGKRITLNNGNTWFTIIGIVGNVKEFGLGAETPYQLYRHMKQAGFIGSALVRTSLQGGNMADQIRRALREVEPRMAVVRVASMENVREKSVSSPRTLTHLFSLFGGLAFVIAVAGIASMLSLWVRQRTRETGIRMALGASPQRIRASVLLQGMMLAVAGIVAGIGGAMVVMRMLSGLLFQIEATDLATYSIASLLLLIAALLACYVPARRASRVDPQIALRTE
jgi:putative ABC transport system permease protein